MKTAIYTSIVGNRANLLTPPVVHDGVDYIAFVDKFYGNQGVWQQINISDVAGSFSMDERYVNRRNAKIYKVLPHLFLPQYDLTIWVDGNMYCKVHPIVYIKSFYYQREGK